MTKERFSQMIEILKRESENWDAPAQRLSRTYRYPRTPYTIMISTLLSFRTKDEVTVAAGHRLFAVAHTPEAMLRLSAEEIEKLIYPVGFYRKKARSVLDVSRTLLERFGGEVPDTLEGLTQIKGIGPKTAKIVLENAFGESVLAVDTHVHRILNLWGFVVTKTPEETDRSLQEKLLPKEQKGLNKLLVSFGQTICRPLAPRCDICPVSAACPSAKV